MRAMPPFRSHGVPSEDRKNKQTEGDGSFVRSDFSRLKATTGRGWTGFAVKPI